MRLPDSFPAILLCLSAVWGAAPALAASPPAKPAELPAVTEPGGEEVFRSHQAGAVRLGRKFQEFFGAAPAVASAPYLSLAAISGAALFADTEYARSSTNPVVRGMCDSAPVQTARRYSSGTLFGLLAFMALVSFVASSGKLRATVGKLLGMAEGSVATAAYLALSIGAFAAPAMAAEPPSLALMGLDVPQAVLLGLAIAFGLGVMLVVRFAFDVLIWLSPFPLVDFLFETAKNIVSVGLLALYFLSPALAAGVAAVLLVISLLLYGWAVRVMELTFGVVLRPFLARFVPALRTSLIETDVVSRLGLASGAPRIATPVTALVLRGVPKRRSGSLVLTGDGLFFVPRTYLRKSRWLPLGQGPQKPIVSRGLFWIELRTTAPDGRIQRIALSRTLVPEAGQMRALLGAEDGGFLGGAGLLQRLADKMAGGPRLQPVSGPAA